MFDQLVAVALFEIAGFLAALALFIGYQLLTGGISTDGLFAKSEKDRSASANEVQLLFFTLVAAGTYLLQAAEAKNGQLPNIPTEILALFVASHGFYNTANGLPSLIKWLTGHTSPEGKTS